MKNYFKKIFSLFVEYDYSKQTTQHFYKWLTNSEHEEEKDEVIRELYSEAILKGETAELENSLERWRLNNNIVTTPPQKKTSKTPFIHLWHSAAAILLIVSISLGYLLYKEKRNDSDLVQLFIPNSQMKTFQLSDGSQVQMNSRSILLYPPQFTGENRTVFLIGEANFKVKPNKKKPFIVKTDGFQVTALGTEFNVSAYAEDKNIIATLLTGSVLVEYDNMTKKKILHPNEQLMYNKENRQDDLVYPNIKDVTAWQRDELIFKQMSLPDIITVLERKYDYQFIYSLHSLKKDRYSFQFRKHAPLSEVMDVIVDVVGGLSFNIQGDKCYIKQE